MILLQSAKFIGAGLATIGLAGAGVFHYAGKGLKNIKLKDRFISFRA